MRANQLFGEIIKKQRRYEKGGFPYMWAKFCFIGTFICSIVSDKFLVFIRKQPIVEVHKWANPSKMLSFFKETLNYKSP